MVVLPVVCVSVGQHGPKSSGRSGSKQLDLEEVLELLPLSRCHDMMGTTMMTYHRLVDANNYVCFGRATKPTPILDCRLAMGQALKSAPDRDPWPKKELDSPNWAKRQSMPKLMLRHVRTSANR